MRVTKIGHSCLLVEVDTLTVLTDPGLYNPEPQMKSINIILITHEHDDHCYIPQLQAILKENPKAEIITHQAVGTKLEGAGIAWTTIHDGETIERNGVSIARYGRKHAEIHPELPIIDNAGFLIAKRLFYPGDALYVPPVEVEILALPTAAPWMRVSESIEYARAVKPKVAFPVHDGIMRPEARGFAKMLAPRFLSPMGIEFRDALEGALLEF